jgi:phosphate transport system substrate-binding protein
VYARDDRSGTWDTFKSLVLAKDYRLAATARRFESNDELSDRVAADRAAIGFVGLASVRNSKLLAIADAATAAIKPDRLTVATEDYPLSRRLYFYLPTQGKLNDQAAEYVDHCLSERGQDIVSQVGFVTQNIIAVDQPQFDNGPPSYRRLAEYAQRLSVNFRFAEGSSLLDNKAKKDIRRVASFLKRPENSRRSVYLVGFSDQASEGKYVDLIARFRALSVQAQLMREDIAVVESLSLGAFLPVAAENNRSARLKNSRVEIWLAAPAKQ